MTAVKIISGWLLYTSTELLRTEIVTDSQDYPRDKNLKLVWAMR